MEVAPTAHYSMGGVVVDPETHATDVEGLFAAGEVTTGLHGANRLGGNSLAEILVFGKRAGEAAADLSRRRDVSLRSRKVVAAASRELDEFIHEGTEFARPLQRAVRDAMWEPCGVVRDAIGLEAGLEKLAQIRSLVPEIDVRPTSEGFGDLAHALDLRATLVSAEASLRGALARTETRGAHNRSDFPDRDEELRVNFVFDRGPDGALRLEPSPVPSGGDDVLAFVDDQQLELEGRLLE